MRRDLLRHLSYLEEENLDVYTFETRRSQYPGVKSDIFVFDGDGRPLLSSSGRSSTERLRRMP
jgi:hypothetical protein